MGRRVQSPWALARRPVLVRRQAHASTWSAKFSCARLANGFKKAQYLFTNDVRGRFIGAQSQEDGLPKLIVAGPLGKLDLGDQDRFDQRQRFITAALAKDGYRNPLALQDQS